MNNWGGGGKFSVLFSIGAGALEIMFMYSDSNLKLKTCMISMTQL